MGQVSGISHGGGIAGWGYAAGSDGVIEIERTYHAGNLLVRSNAGAGIGNAIEGIQIRSSYAESTAIQAGTPAQGFELKSRDEMLRQAAYEGFDFGSVWTMDPNANNGYPSLQIAAPPAEMPPISSDYVIELSRFGIYNDGTHSTETVTGINEAIRWAHENGIETVYLPSGTYLIPADDSIHLEGQMLFEMAPDAVVQVESNGLEAYRVFHVGYGDDQVTIRGGQIKGDRYTHDYSQKDHPYSAGTHESGFGIYIESARETVIDGVNISEFTGDGIMVGADAIMGHDIYAGHFESGSIDARGTDVQNANTIRSKRTYPLTHSRFEAEGWFEFSNWHRTGFPIHVFFYDADMNFISSTDAKIRERVNIPEGATQMRLVIDQATSTGIYGEYWNRTPSENTVIRNSDISFNRRQGITVGGAKNILIENNVIHNISGVAPMSGIDVEAGTGENGAWNEGVTIRGNRFYDNARYDVILYDGYGAVIENNYLGSAGAYGLAEGTAYAGGAVVRNNTFDKTNIIVYKDVKFYNNVMNRGMANFSGTDIIVDGLKAENTLITVTNNVYDGIKVSNVELEYTDPDVHASFGIWGSEGTHFKNITIKGQPALRSIIGGNKGYNYFDNLNVIDYHPVYGINLVDGEYKNSTFQIGEGGKSTVGLTTGGKYVFDRVTVISNADGGGNIAGTQPSLDLTIKNSTFEWKNSGSAVNVQQGKSVLIDHNVFKATGITRDLPLISIGNYWTRNDPSKVSNVTISNNEVRTDKAGTTGISTEYAGTGSEPYIISNNELFQAVLRAREIDQTTNNTVEP